MYYQIRQFKIVKFTFAIVFFELQKNIWAKKAIKKVNKIGPVNDTDLCVCKHSTLRTSVKANQNSNLNYWFELVRTLFKMHVNV